MAARLRWLGSGWMAALALAGCGGGGSAPGPVEASAWVDAQRLQAFGAAHTVELGFDGQHAYIQRDGARAVTGPGGRPDLAYIGDSGAPAAGQATQWVSFDLRSVNYFAHQGQHLPLGLRFAQYPDPISSGTAPTGVEGKMIFLGRDGGLWDCAHPQEVGVYFESRVSGRGAVDDISAVKCAHDRVGLVDGVSYHVRLEADAGRMRYRISDSASGQLLSAGETGDTDYPPLAWSQPFMRLVASGQPSPYLGHWRALNDNTGFAFVAAMTNTATPWSLTFSNVATGWLP